MNWSVTAEELNNFCNINSRRAQELLPELTYKLIKASIELNKLHMPTGNSISNPGFDGIIETQQEHEIIPYGKSVWEFSIDKNINSKAKKDYSKRLKDSNSEVTFVFGTFRLWANKEIFCGECKNKGKWKEVRALNSVDYEAWLKDHLVIALWLARTINKLPPQNIKLISARLEDWRKQTQIATTSDLVLLNRNVEQNVFKEKLNSKKGVINIVAPTQLEGLIFALSIIKKDSGDMEGL